MITQRFNPNPDWQPRVKNSAFNYSLFGFTELLTWTALKLNSFDVVSNFRALEIGSHMGESTKLIAASRIFKEIVAIDPHKGQEEFNDMYNLSWNDIKREFYNNIKHFDNVELIPDYSFNVADRFENKSFDFIYIDAAHDYESVIKEIDLFWPKLKQGGIMAGHDYVDQWPGVIQAVDTCFGKPTEIFRDSSWAVQKAINN